MNPRWCCVGGMLSTQAAGTSQISPTLCVCVYLCIYVYVCVYRKCMYTYMHTYMLFHIHTYVYIYVCMYVHTLYTYIHTKLYTFYIWLVQRERKEKRIRGTKEEVGKERKRRKGKEGYKICGNCPSNASKSLYSFFLDTCLSH